MDKEVQKLILEKNMERAFRKLLALEDFSEDELSLFLDLSLNFYEKYSGEIEDKVKNSILNKDNSYPPYILENLIFLLSRFEKDDKIISLLRKLEKEYSLEREFLDDLISYLKIQNKSSLLARIKKEFPLIEIKEVKEELIEKFKLFFRGRKDVFAEQVYIYGKWGYHPVYQNLTDEVLKEHLTGERTLGVYQLVNEEQVYFMAFDIDIKKYVLGIMEKDTSFEKEVKDETLNFTLKLASVLKEKYNFKVIIENSGYKGYHLWVCFSEPVSAQICRAFFYKIFQVKETEFKDHKWFEIEFFPKQSKVKEKGLGNLIKLPLGKHQKSKQFSYFLSSDGEKLEPLMVLKEKNLNLRETIYNLFASKDTAFVREKNLKNDKKEKEVKVSEKSSFHLDIETYQPSPQVNILEMSCNVLNYIFQRAQTEKYLEPHLKHIYIYVLAKLGKEGERRIHQVLSECYDYDPDWVAKKIRSVPVAPISCPKIRKHLRKFNNYIPCNCSFKAGEGEYPSPILHINLSINKNGDNSAGNSNISLSGKERIAFKYWKVKQEIEKLLEVEKALKKQLASVLEPNETIELPLGILKAVEEKGERIITFRRKEAK